MKHSIKYDSENHITKSEYFKEKHHVSSNKARINFKGLLRSILSYFINKYTNLELVSRHRFKRESMFSNLLHDDNINNYRREAIYVILSSWLKEMNFSIDKLKLIKQISEFENLFFNKANNFTSLHGGMGYNKALFCFFFIKYINPDFVYESGVWRGFSTVIIDGSIKEDGIIFCFDINLKKLEWKSKKAKYFEHDIEEHESQLTSKNKLALFDDHVSHYDRIKYCLKQNINSIILDEDISISAVHSDGWPPIPSTNMLFNYNKIPKKFLWEKNTSLFEADISNLDVDDIIKKYKYIKMPDISKITGYKEDTEMAFLLNKS